MTPSERAYLRGQASATLLMINDQIAEIERECQNEDMYAKGTRSFQLKNTDGTYVLMPLLVAKAHALHVLVSLERKV